MRRFALVLLLVIFVPSLFACPTQAASPEDVQKIRDFMASKAASERVLSYHSHASGQATGVELIYEGRMYAVSYYPYARDTKDTVLPKDKQQLVILARDDTPGWDNAVMVIDTGFSGKAAMYVDMVQDQKTKVIRSRGVQMPEEQKQANYDKIIKAVLAFYGQQ